MPLDDLSGYSKDEIIEKCKRNPFFFIRNFCKIKHPKRGIIHFDLYDYQEDISKDILNPDKKFFSIVKSRQLGVSTLMAGLALWITTFRNAVEIIIVSTDYKTAKKLHEKVKLMYDSVPKFLRQPTKQRNKSVTEFENQSRVECIAYDPQKGTRSIAATWIIIDEAHFIDHMDDLWTSIAPSVDHGEKVITLSSPNGPQGWFHKVCVEADEDDSPWNKIRLPWQVHPDRQLPDGSPDWDWRNQQDKLMGKRQAQQEYDAVFGVSTDTYFDPEYIERQEEMFVREPLEKDGKMWYWEKPKPNTEYLVTVDCAEGGGDNHSVQVYKIATLEQVAEYVSNIAYEQFGYIPVRIAKEYNNALLAIEQNSVGTAVTQRAVDLDYHNLYFRGANNDNIALDIKNAKVGWKTTTRTRPLIIEAFRSLFETKDGIKIRSTRLLNEIKNFILKNGKPQARSGYTDDAVMASCIMCFIYNTHKFNIENYGDANDMLSLMALANGKAKEEFEKIEAKKYEDLINEREQEKKKSFAKSITGGMDQEILNEFDWVI